MADPVSALAGASHSGRLRVADAGLTGMVTIRAEIDVALVRSAIGRVTGVDVPAQGAAAMVQDRSILWMSPDELLLVCPYDKALELGTEVDLALEEWPHLVHNVSDARTVFALDGDGLRETLAKLTPADLRPKRFRLGQLRRTRLAQVPAAIWLTGENSARILVFRSVSNYVFDLLKRAADPAGAYDHF